MSQLLGVLLIVLIGTSVSAGTETSYSHLQKSLPQAMGLLSGLCRYLHTLCNMLGMKHHSPSLHTRHSPSLHTPLSLPTRTTLLPYTHHSPSQHIPLLFPTTQTLTSPSSVQASGVSSQPVWSWLQSLRPIPGRLTISFWAFFSLPSSSHFCSKSSLDCGIMCMHESFEYMFVPVKTTHPRSVAFNIQPTWTTKLLWSSIRKYSWVYPMVVSSPDPYWGSGNETNPMDVLRPSHLSIGCSISTGSDKHWEFYCLCQHHLDPMARHKWQNQ